MKTQKQIKQLTQAQFQDVLIDNTDKNYHTENVIYLAYRYGTRYHVAYAEMIHFAELKIGHMTPVLIKKRNEVLDMVMNNMLPCHIKTLSECL